MIIHVDMDAFYASVEQRDNPQLAGRPVAVGGTPEQRGVVAAASYEARQLGVRSAMSSHTAIKLCPELVFIAMRMPHYVAVSKEIREIFRRYTPLVEPLSIDEAFLDVTGSTRLFGDATTIAKRIKNEIRSELNLTASVGIAPNKFVAKIASDLQKPDGLVSVTPPLELFLDPLPVERLWGVGKVSKQKLHSAGISTIRQFREADPSILMQCVGNSTEHLLRLARGEDDRKVIPHQQSVTISKETTFATDVTEIDYLENTLLRLTEQITSRLRNKNLSARTIGIKIRFADFKTITRSKTLPSATNVTQVIWENVRRLLHSAVGDKFQIRLVGVQTSSLENTTDDPQSLFEFDQLERQRKIDGVVDEINQKYGSDTLRRGIGRK